MFPRNVWYVACTPDEFADKLLDRTICGERPVFYRDVGGAVATLEDCCPHERAYGGGLHNIGCDHRLMVNKT